MAGGQDRRAAGDIVEDRSRRNGPSSRRAFRGTRPIRQQSRRPRCCPMPAHQFQNTQKLLRSHAEEVLVMLEEHAEQAEQTKQAEQEGNEAQQPIQVAPYRLLPVPVEQPKRQPWILSAIAPAMLVASGSFSKLRATLSSGVIALPSFLKQRKSLAYSSSVSGLFSHSSPREDEPLFLASRARAHTPPPARTPASFAQQSNQ